MQTFKTKVENALKLIKKAVKEHKRIAVACSFGKDSMTLVHLAQQVKPDIQIFSVLTPFKPYDTYVYADEMIRKYNMNWKDFGHGMIPETSFERLGLPYGLWKKDVKACCEIYKVKPFKKAVKELKLTALIAGVRKDEGKTRINCKEIETKQGLVKYNAILNFTEKDIWKYLAMNQIPPHPGYKKGYRSLGCEPCTGLCDDSESERAGRWKGTCNNGGECNIHLSKLK